MSRRALIYSAVILACVGAALFVEWATTPPPATRHIHIEAFRYGTEPSIIRANRGDRLVLRFSTRDTGHSFFLQDYGIDAKISPGSELVEIRDPVRIDRPPRDVGAVRLEAGLKGPWGRLVSASRFRCHVYCGPMHGFEQGDPIVRPNWLMAGSLGLLLGIVAVGFVSAGRRSYPTAAPPLPPTDLNGRWSFLDGILKWRPFQFVTVLPFLALFVVGVLAALFGTKVGGRNMGVMLTWIGWMSLLTLLMLPLGGRIWCLVCPLPILGEIVQRGETTQVRSAHSGRYGNRFLGLARPWPRKLRGPWIRLVLFLGLGTLSASLAGQPRWTGFTLLSLVLLPVIISFIWELRAFCRYVCPVAAYIAPYSVQARLMVRSREKAICRQCLEKSCLNGNERGWACPYGLTLATLDSNRECGLCMECFKSCRYDNVTLQWRRKPWKEGDFGYGGAWQVIVLLVLALVYSLTVHAPWPFMRDMVNLVDKAPLPQFGLYAAVLWVTALCVFPALFWLGTAMGLRMAGQRTTVDDADGAGISRECLDGPGITTALAFRRTMPALIPFGLAMWMAFFTATIMVNATFILLSFSDPLGRGWDLFGWAGMPWVQIWPSGIPWIQAGFTLAGLVFSLRKGHDLWLDLLHDPRRALRGFLPSASILVAIAASMLLYFTYF